MRISLDSFRALLLKTKDIAYRKNIILSVNFMRLGFPDFPLSIIPQLIFDSLGCELAIQTYSRLDFTNAIYSRYHTPIMPGLSSLSSSAFREDPDKRLLSATLALLFMVLHLVYINVCLLLLMMITLFGSIF